MSTVGRDITGWQICLTVPASAVDIFVEAFEPVSHATAIFVDDECENLWQLTAYTSRPPLTDQVAKIISLATLKAKISEPTVKCLPLEEADWVAVSQQTLEPIIAGRYFIKPSFMAEAVSTGSISLIIDAGTAFGSGDHGTTRGCLLALDKIAKYRTFNRSLDLGCGSGILAIAMAQTWRNQVVASDIDPNAVSVTNENAKLNGVSRFVDAYCASGIDVTIGNVGPYDLIVSNILLGPLIKLSSDVAGHLNSDGMAIVSGILQTQEKELRLALEGFDLHLIHRIELDGWHTLVLAKV